MAKKTSKKRKPAGCDDNEYDRTCYIVAEIDRDKEFKNILAGNFSTLAKAQARLHFLKMKYPDMAWNNTKVMTLTQFDKIRLRRIDVFLDDYRNVL